MGPGCSLPIAYGGYLGPWGDRPAPGWESLCCTSGGHSRGRVSRAGLRGVAQTPPSVVQGERAGQGWADPGAFRAESEPAPAPNL